METPRVQGEEQGLLATVHTAPRDISVHHVARLMKARGVKTVVVVDGLQPVGIVTDCDIVVRVAAPGSTVTRVTVGAIMSSPLVAAAESEDVAAAIARMQCHGINRLPILDQAGRLVTLLTLNDLLHIPQPALVSLADLLRGQTRLPESGSQVSLATHATTFAELGVPAMPPVHAPAGAPAAVFRRVTVSSMIKRRRWARIYFDLRAWYQRNTKWVILALVIAVVGAGIALVIGSFYEYKFQYYEPKDATRGQHLEQKEQKEQEGK